MEMEQGWFRKYSNAAYVDLGFGETSGYREYTKRCAEWLGWDCDELAGDAKLMIDFLDGNWTERDFLIVEPGQGIVASYDEMIIECSGESPDG